MNRKVAVVWISLAMVLSLIVIVVEVAPPARGNVVYVGGIGPGNFTTIQEGIAAANPGDTVFVYNGTQPTVNLSIILYPGWNLVGYPSLTNKTRDAALNNLDSDTHVDAIWTFDTATQTWEEVGSLNDFELGRGYWIHATTDCVWVAPL